MRFLAGYTYALKNQDRTVLRREGQTFEQMAGSLVWTGRRFTPLLKARIMQLAAAAAVEEIDRTAPVRSGRYRSSTWVSKRSPKLARQGTFDRPKGASGPALEGGGFGFTRTPSRKQNRKRVIREISEKTRLVYITNDAKRPGARTAYAPFLEIPRHASPQAPRGIFGPAVRYLHRNAKPIMIQAITEHNP